MHWVGVSKANNFANTFWAIVSCLESRIRLIVFYIYQVNDMLGNQPIDKKISCLCPPILGFVTRYTIDGSHCCWCVASEIPVQQHVILETPEWCFSMTWIPSWWILLWLQPVECDKNTWIHCYHNQTKQNATNTHVLLPWWCQDNTGLLWG